MPIIDAPRIRLEDLGVMACSPESFAERAFRLTMANVREEDADPCLDRIHLPRDRWLLLLGLVEVLAQRRDLIFDPMWALPGRTASNSIAGAMKALRERKDRGIDEAHRHILKIFVALREQEADRFEFPVIYPLP